MTAQPLRRLPPRSPAARWQSGHSEFHRSLRLEERRHGTDIDAERDSDRRNAGSNYNVSFVNNTTGVITARPHHGDGGDQQQGL